MYPRHIYAHAMLSLLLLSSATSNAMNQWLPHMPQRKDLPLIGATVVATLFGSWAYNKIRNSKFLFSDHSEGYGYKNNEALEADQEKLKKESERQKVLKAVIYPALMWKYQKSDGTIDENAITQALVHDALLDDAASKGSFAQEKLGMDDNKLHNYKRMVNGIVKTFPIRNHTAQALYLFRGVPSVFDDREKSDTPAKGGGLMGVIA